MTDRIQKLRLLLGKQPDDAFLLYAIALELKKAGDLPGAIGHLDRVLEVDPGYCYAYYQKGQAYEQSGDAAAARETYQQGAAVAQTKGDAKARDEITAALEAISG